MSIKIGVKFHPLLAEENYGILLTQRHPPRFCHPLYSPILPTSQSVEQTLQPISTKLMSQVSQVTTQKCILGSLIKRGVTIVPSHNPNLNHTYCISVSIRSHPTFLLEL